MYDDDFLDDLMVCEICEDDFDVERIWMDDDKYFGHYYLCPDCKRELNGQEEF